MGVLLRILVFVAIAFVIYRLFFASRSVASTGGRSAAFKCGTCKHCGKLFDDGVLCRFAGRETFKNEVHIGNCVDYHPR